MPELTWNEREVLRALRRECRYGDAAMAGTVKARLWPAIHDGQVQRALTSLVAKGELTRPSRGFYMPASTEAGTDGD